MNIQERYFCSRCLKELKDEQICPYCGHNPEKTYSHQALEEGTLLAGGRYQIGAVADQKENSFLYGAWDFVGDCPAFIKEYFPRGAAVRGKDGDKVIVPSSGKKEFADGMKKFYKNSLTESCVQEGISGERKERGKQWNVVKENGTLYLVVRVCEEEALIKTALPGP